MFAFDFHNSVSPGAKALYFNTPGRGAQNPMKKGGARTIPHAMTRAEWKRLWRSPEWRHFVRDV